MGGEVHKIIPWAVVGFLVPRKITFVVTPVIRHESIRVLRLGALTLLRVVVVVGRGVLDGDARCIEDLPWLPLTGQVASRHPRSLNMESWAPVYAEA